MNRHKKLIQNTIIMLAGKVFTQFLTFLLLPLYTRLISVSDYGTIDLLLTYINLLAPVITMQQEMATFRFLIDNREKNEKVGEIIRTSLKSVIFRLALFSVPYLVLCLFIDSEYKFLALLAGIFITFSNLFLQVARGLGENLKYTIGTAIAGVTTILSNLFLICILDMGGESLILSMIFANFACIIYLLFALKVPKYVKLSRNNKTLAREMLGYSWPLVPNGISWWLINASDRTIISAFLGFFANGIYAVANKFPSIISGFLGIYTMALTENASLHINDKDKDEFFSSIAQNTLRLFSSLCLLIIAILPFIFDFIIGKDYRDSYQYIPIFIVASMANCMVSVYSAIYIAKKMTKKVMVTSIASAVINIVIDLVLINFIGLYAAVLSTALAYLIMVIYRHFDLKRYINITYKFFDIALMLAGFAIICTLYFLNTFELNIICMLLAVAYGLIQNRKIISSILKHKKFDKK